MESEREQRIRERAYELWERDGRPEGQEMSHWEQAEREVAGDLMQRVPEGQAPEHSGGTAHGMPSEATDDMGEGAITPPAGVGARKKRP